MRQRKLGGLEVSALGLGCMGMSEFYGSTDDGQSTATIRRALDLGVTFLDTSDMYGSGHNEQLVGGAIAGRRDEVQLATKFAIRRDDNGERASTTGPSGSARPATRPCGASAWTTSTSTTCTAARRRCRSRRASAPWASSWRRARCGSSASPR